MVADLPLIGTFFKGDADIGRGYGLLIASWGIGSVVGSIAARRLSPAIDTKWLVLTNGGFAVTMGLVGVAPVFVFVLVMVLLNGTCDAVGLVALRSIQVRRTPDVIRSRVMAAMDGAQNISLAVGYAMAGVLVRLVGPKAVYLLAGAGALLGTAVVWPLRRRVIQDTMQREEVQA
jgi:predicted MFS family arabinose efflux permease